MSCQYIRSIYGLSYRFKFVTTLKRHTFILFINKYIEGTLLEGLKIFIPNNNHVILIIRIIIIIIHITYFINEYFDYIKRERMSESISCTHKDLLKQPNQQQQQ